MDRYELLYPIAQGGMGEVWTARQHGSHGFEKLVALKTVLPEHARDEVVRKMFLDEARIASAIEHENVAQILDLGELSGLVYLTMEWVNGDSLSKMQRLLGEGERIPIGVALRIVADACAGLHAAHELRNERGELLELVHRDVSPHNILVSTRGKAKLIDFGVAKAKERMAGDTSSGMLKGKFRFMAPEQVRPSGSVDRRADVWAMGVTLYHLLTGIYPIAGDNEANVLVALLTGEPVRPLTNDVPGPVAEVVMRALALDRDARFATALEMQSALEHAMSALGQTTTAEVAAYVTTRFADRARARQDALHVAHEALKDRSVLNRRLKNEMVHESTSQSRLAGELRQASAADGDAAAKRLAVVSSPPEPTRREARSASDLRTNTVDRAFFDAEAVLTNGTGAFAPQRPRPWGRTAAVGFVAAATLGIALVSIRRAPAREPATVPAAVLSPTPAPAEAIPPPEPAPEPAAPKAALPVPAPRALPAPRDTPRARVSHATSDGVSPRPTPAAPPPPVPSPPPSPTTPGDIERAIDVRK